MKKLTRKQKIIFLFLLPVALTIASYPVNLVFMADGGIYWYCLPFSLAYLAAWILVLMAGIRLKSADLVKYYRAFWIVELSYMFLFIIGDYVEAIAGLAYVMTPVFFLPLAGLTILFDFISELFPAIPLLLLSLVMVSLGYTLNKKPKDVWEKIKRTGPKVLAALAAVVILAAILLKTLVYTGQYYWSNELVWAIEKKNIGKVETLLKNKDMDVDRKGGTEFPESISFLNDSRIPLELACDLGSVSIVKMLLNRGADPNKTLPDESYGTPLLSTLYWYEPGDYEIVKLLLDHGARVEKSEGGEVLPIFSAVSLNPTTDEDGSVYDAEAADNIARIYRLLLEKSPDKTPRSENGTLLIYAAEAQNLALVEYLVEKQKVPVNEQDEAGRTALIAAAGYFDTDLGQGEKIVALLLSHGADKTIKDEDGKTAYDHAVESGNKELAEMLE